MHIYNAVYRFRLQYNIPHTVISIGYLSVRNAVFTIIYSIHAVGRMVALLVISKAFCIRLSSKRLRYLNTSAVLVLLVIFGKGSNCQPSKSAYGSNYSKRSQDSSYDLLSHFKLLTIFAQNENLITN